MRRRRPYDQQSEADVRRAQRLVATTRGCTLREGAEALRARATDLGVSLHAAALAVLTARPVDPLLRDQPVR
jgi:hypothetical protein